jgi:tRNA U34 5-methylaminomethyl-2-thiouridine-forming methyltransferase MnmC
MQNNISAVHEFRSPEGDPRSHFRWWKWSRSGKIPLRNARVAQKITSWRRARWTACFIAITTIVHPAQSQQTKPAEPTVAAANRAVQSRLPFSDRQDFEDAMRGFIATTPDAANPDRYAFLKHEAPPTVNPSLWRQAQLNATNGLFKPTPD